MPGQHVHTMGERLDVQRRAYSRSIRSRTRRSRPRSRRRHAGAGLLVTCRIVPPSHRSCPALGGRSSSAVGSRTLSDSVGFVVDSKNEGLAPVFRNRNTLLLPPVVYSRSSIVAATTTVAAVDINELRSGVRQWRAAAERISLLHAFLKSRMCCALINVERTTRVGSVYDWGIRPRIDRALLSTCRRAGQTADRGVRLVTSRRGGRLECARL